MPECDAAVSWAWSGCRGAGLTGRGCKCHLYPGIRCEALLWMAPGIPADLVLRGADDSSVDYGRGAAPSRADDRLRAALRALRVRASVAVRLSRTGTDFPGSRARVLRDNGNRCFSGRVQPVAASSS